jgi:glycosyltransferase involved in cell wall biosynthesis
MKVLFIHQNFPGQYSHIAKRLAEDRDNEVVALAVNRRPTPDNLRVIYYHPQRGSSPRIHPFAADFETKMIRAEAAARAAQKLKTDGFFPDVICAHPGWGEVLFIPDVWPAVPIITYFEYYYRAIGSDINFDREFPNAPEQAWATRSKNATLLLSLELSTKCVTPTLWQASQIPKEFVDRLHVIHDGIDTSRVRPRPAIIKLASMEHDFTAEDEIVTFINRNLEPYRGYHSFMRALPLILGERPNAHAIIVGGDGTSYGARPVEGTWKARFLREVSDRLDLSRVHFVGNLSYPIYLDLLNVSRVHVYLTYPFVLSWSMLEAMATECLVVGSRTPPVTEVIEDGINGILADFFSPDEIAKKVIDALARPTHYRSIRTAARKTIQERYDLHEICLPKHLSLIKRVAGRAGEVAAQGALA